VNRTNRDLGFATAAGDTWRPVEILADAITLITHNFCDGYQENGIRNIRNTTANVNIPGKDNGRCKCERGLQWLCQWGAFRPEYDCDYQHGGRRVCQS
jgi:hypothetical protein